MQPNDALQRVGWPTSRPTTINKQNQNQRNNPMKTNSSTTWKILTLLLAAFAAFSTWAVDQVPFQGSAEGSVVSVSPDPAGAVLTVLAEGNATSLGRFSREETVLFNPLTGTLTGLVIFTAANGDQLFGTLAGGFVSATTATGAYTFTGGTGRFANATGTANFVVTTADGIHLSVEIQGTISSVGSAKP
jgi:hypothetical protein